MSWIYDVNKILGGNPLKYGPGNHIDYDPETGVGENVKAIHINYVENAIGEIQNALDLGDFFPDSLTLIESDPQYGDFKSLEIQWTQDPSNYTDQYGIYFDNPLGSGSGNLTALYIGGGYTSGIYSLSNSYFSDIQTSAINSLNSFYSDTYTKTVLDDYWKIVGESLEIYAPIYHYNTLMYPEGTGIEFGGSGSYVTFNSNIFTVNSEGYPLWLGGTNVPGTRSVVFNADQNVSGTITPGDFVWTGNLGTVDIMELNTTELDLYNKPIVNLTDPSNPQDAATKNYVDTNFTDFLASSNTFTGTNRFNQGIYAGDELNNGLLFYDSANKVFKFGNISDYLDGINLGDLSFNYDVEIGNAGNSLPLLKLVNTAYHQDNPGTGLKNHYVNTTELRFNHTIEIPNLYNGDSDIYGPIGTRLWFIGDATGYTGSLGFIKSDRSAGVGLIWMDALNALALDTSFGGNFDFILNSSTGTEVKFLKNDYVTEVVSIDGAGNIDAVSYSVGGTSGASGSFTTSDGKTVTVTNGLITSIS